MKFLLLLLAAAWFVLGGEPAHAGPLVAAISAISSFVSGLGLVGKLIIGLAINIGASLLQKALAKDESSTTSGVDLEVKMGDDVPVAFTVGTYVTGGRRKYIGTWGSDGDTPNAYLVDVVEIGNIPCSGLNGFWAGEDKVTILWDEPHADGRGYPVEEYRKSGKDYLWIKFYDGTNTEADTYLLNKFGSHSERPWLSTMIGRGCPYAIMTCRYNTDLYSGLPEWAFEPGPPAFYDLRLDSTNGGFGSHRWGDASTWEITSNPIVIAYNIIRGIYYGTEWMFGGQNLAAFRLPSSNWIAAANECDASVALADGSTEPAYRCGYEITVDMEPLEVLEQLEQAASARFAEVGGVFKVLVGAPGGAVYSFTDDDIIVTEGQSLDPFPTIDETYNALNATYPEPDEKWQKKDAPERAPEELYIEDDENYLPASVSFAAVPFVNQVQRLMVAMLQDYRRFRVHQFYLPPDAWPLEPNDVVSWTSVRNGYEEKKFLVVSVAGQRAFNRLVTLKEIDPSDYDWNTSLQLPTATGWIGSISAPVQVITGWTVEPDTIKDDQGNDRRPAIKVSCSPDVDGVTHIEIDVRVQSTNQLILTGARSRYESPFSWTVDGNFPANTWLEARGRYVSSMNTVQEWSEWLPVKTPDILLGQLDIYTEGMVEEIQQSLAYFTEFSGTQTRELIEAAQKIALGDIDKSFGSYDEIQMVRTEIKLVRDDITSSYMNAITVAAGPGSSLVQRLETAESKIASVDALSSALSLLQTTVTAQGSQISATSTALTALDTTVGKFSASGLLRITATSSPTGSGTAIALSAAASASGNAATAALYLQALSDGTSLAMISATRFAIVSGSAVEYPFVFENGVARLNVAYIGEILGGSLNINNRFIVTEEGAVTIRSSLSGLRLQLVSGLLSVYDSSNVLRVKLGVWS